MELQYLTSMLGMRRGRSESESQRSPKAAKASCHTSGGAAPPRAADDEERLRLVREMNEDLLPALHLERAFLISQDPLPARWWLRRMHRWLKVHVQALRTIRASQK